MRPQSIEARYVYRFEESDESVAIDATLETHASAFELPVMDDVLNALPGDETDGEGFWRRQFSSKATSGQRRFDWAIGVFLPLACFYFDPLVFRTSWGHAELGQYQIFAYSLAFLSIMSMTAWLLLGERLRWLNAWIAGVFLTGSVISLMVGLLIFPFSLLGLLYLIGILGFTPLLTSVVYLRNAVRAVETARPAFDSRTLLYVVWLSGLISLVVPYVINNVIR